MSIEITSDFNFKSHWADVLGSKLHYIEAGEGDPILFIHGIPTWSYMWRNVIPPLQKHGRCIAVDLIGMGKSDKPDIEYTVFDHIKYLTAFIEALNLKNVTLVMHAWGSVIGFHYAMQHPNNIKGLVFLEGHVRPPLKKEMVSLLVQERHAMLNAEDGGRAAVIDRNEYIEKIFPHGIIRRLTKEEMDHYREPFAKAKDRQPIWQFLQELPLGDKKTPITELIDDYSKKLQTSQLPKLMIYAIPGYNNTIETVMWAREHLPNLTVIEVEDALHYAPESKPVEVVEAIESWLESENSN